MKLEKKAAVKLCAIALFLFLCVYYWPLVQNVFLKILGALTPIMAGLAVAYVLNILMTFYEKHYFSKKSSLKIVVKTRRPVCLVASIVTLVMIISLVLMLVVPELVLCIKILVEKIPPFMEKFLSNAGSLNIIPESILQTLSSIDWQGYISNIARMLTSGIGGAAATVFTAITSVFSAITTLFLSSIFAIYLLLSKEKLLCQLHTLIKTYIPKGLGEKISYTFSVLNDSFHRYIVGQCTEAVILGVLCAVGMSILRFPYAFMIGALVGLTALIPIAGAYIGAGVGAIMILTESPIKALLFVVFIIVLQQIEGNLIYPKVVGKSIGLPAIYVLAAITVGGGLCGIAGMLIGVPLMSAVYRIVCEDVSRRKKIHH